MIREKVYTFYDIWKVGEKPEITFVSDNAFNTDLFIHNSEHIPYKSIPYSLSL